MLFDKVLVLLALGKHDSIEFCREEVFKYKGFCRFIKINIQDFNSIREFFVLVLHVANHCFSSCFINKLQMVFRITRADYRILKVSLKRFSAGL